MWAEAGHCHKALCVTGILIILESSVISPHCEWHDGKEPFRLVIVRICALNLVAVTGHCSLSKRHVRDLHGTQGLDAVIRLVWAFMFFVGGCGGALFIATCQ